MASCSTFATATNSVATFTESTFSTVSETVTTPPGSVSTQTVSTCVPVTIRGSFTTCSPTMTVTEVTLPGVPTTITVPVTGVTQIPITILATLFGTGCTTVPTPPPVPPTSVTLPPSTTPPLPSPTTLTSLTVITSDSSTFTSTFTTTSSFTSSTTDLPAPTGSSSNKTSPPIGAIVGGVVGGITAIAVLGFLTWYLIRKQSGFDNFFNRDEDGTLNNGPSLKPQPTDKLYNYQLVGENGTGPANQASGPNFTGQDMGNAPPQQPSSAPGHVRTPSMTPLIASVAGAAAISGAIAVAAGTSRRSNDSSQPLGGPTAAPHAAGGPPSSYPPNMQNWQTGQSQGVYNPVHGHPQTQGYAGMNANAMGYPPGPPSHLTSMYTGSSATPGTPGTMNTGILGHNTSVSSGSMYSGSTSPPASQWGGSPVTTPFGGPAILPVMTGMSQQSHPQQQQFGHPPQQQFGQPQQQPFGQPQQQHQQFGQPQQSFNPYPQQQQQQQQSAFDPYTQSQTGSSSVAEPPRPLQVINADPFTSTGSFAAYETAGAGSSSAAGGSSSSGAAAAAAAAAGVDGKGRPINTLGEKAALVHLDGGMYQEPTPGQLPAGAAPPAYGE